MPDAEEAGAVAQKKSLIAAERDRPDVARRRQNFAIARRFADPASLVFLDESGAQSNMTRLYGRSRIGQRCVDATPQGHWQTSTLLSALRLDGVVRQATVVLDGPMNGQVFQRYVQVCLAPSLRAGDVVVMDNLSCHRAAKVVEAIEAVGASVWFLPPYSPDLNPIEKLWSKTKGWLRRVRPPNLDAISQAVADVLATVTATECGNYFRSCGYGT